MKLQKIILAGAVALGLAGTAIVTEPTLAAAASSSVTIDGNFSDWQDANLTEGYNGDTALASSGKYVEVYVKMKNGPVPGYGDYNFTIDGQRYYIWSDNVPSNVSKGETKKVTFTGGKTNEGTQYGTVGTGYVSNDGTHNLAEFRVDLTALGLTKAANGKSVTMANPNIGSDSASTTVDDLTNAATSDSASSSSETGVIAGKEDQSSKATTTTDGNANNDNDNLNIVIDGKFADWKHVTLTEGYNGYTAMVSDGNYVYVYVKMKYGLVPGYGDYNFDIGGQKYYVWSKEMPTSPVSAGDAKVVSFTGGKWNEGGQYGTVGDGYVSSEDGHNIAEFKVDLRKFNLSTMTGQTITMYNPNIGNEKVTVAGGSTGPYVIAGIGVVIAGLGYWRLRKSGRLGRSKTSTSGK
ncbi:Firmicu-CTERM sorting domain-containing protein [Levilactobacillus brevis]|uniref:Firmicu-CTERM sorting domain-containing protein n=1 Tax=Levilactobacillus brevis TaxID=1580 RepID=UPI000E095693|nr:Firmicu-CTERM sorting domain-containing protein [Levilactobacillus brevis]RDF82432.1 Firmicu-CTERM sorting domain-containing protein [Levilactobacillus brevis]